MKIAAILFSIITLTSTAFAEMSLQPIKFSAFDQEPSYAFDIEGRYETMDGLWIEIDGRERAYTNLGINVGQAVWPIEFARRLRWDDYLEAYRAPVYIYGTWSNGSRCRYRANAEIRFDDTETWLDLTLYAPQSMFINCTQTLLVRPLYLEMDRVD